MAERDISDWREEYAEHGLDVGDLPADPVAGFEDWLHEARAAGLHEPNAMVLATTSLLRLPSSRMVLLKSVDNRGFVFFTNLASRKAAELSANPSCSLLFPWHPLQRQVRVEGAARRVTDTEADAYFATRPRTSQIGAWASDQSAMVSGRTELDEAYSRMTERFEDGDVPRPPFWGGYRVDPDAIEFWQGRSSRLHDRLRYDRADGTSTGWSVERLAP